MVEDHPEAAEQAVFVPAADLFQHFVFAGADAFGEHPIGPAGQRQALFQQVAQVLPLRRGEGFDGVHRLASRGNARSMQ